MARPTPPAGRPRPRLRGVFHAYAFVLSLVGGALLLLEAHGPRARLAAAIFAASVTAMFGMSALYHRVTWRPAPRRWMARLDHATVYLLVAGTYTPYGLLVLDGAWRIAVLSVVWGGAVAAIALKFAWCDAPKWLAAAVGLLLGWSGVVSLPHLVARVGVAGTLVALAGGLLYTIGAVVYALRRPDPVPAVFGYHEVFHALVVAGAACFYFSIGLFVVPSP
jgi:hemolysin III